MGQTTKSPTTKFTTKSRAIAASAFDRITIGWWGRVRGTCLTRRVWGGRGRGEEGRRPRPPFPWGRLQASVREACNTKAQPAVVPPGFVEALLISSFWATLQRLIGARSAMTSGYHPQLDAAKAASSVPLSQVVLTFDGKVVPCPEHPSSDYIDLPVQKGRSPLALSIRAVDTSGSSTSRLPGSPRVSLLPGNAATA